ncbi:MAG: hypothetical protein ACF8MF_08820 [Phycisphaerales bacterium JB052]
MPFYEVVGRDVGSLQSRTVQISASDERQALFAASSQGLAEPKLRPYSDRELLMMDLKCFLNAEPAPAGFGAQRKSSERVSYRSSLLLDHPVLTITCSVLLALMLDRIVDLFVAMF